jgi:hypothetical protein
MENNIAIVNEIISFCENKLTEFKYFNEMSNEEKKLNEETTNSFVEITKQSINHFTELLRYIQTNCNKLSIN